MDAVLDHQAHLDEVDHSTIGSHEVVPNLRHRDAVLAGDSLDVFLTFGPVPIGHGEHLVGQVIGAAQVEVLDPDHRFRRIDESGEFFEDLVKTPIRHLCREMPSWAGEGCRVDGRCGAVEADQVAVRGRPEGAVGVDGGTESAGSSAAALVRSS